MDEVQENNSLNNYLVYGLSFLLVIGVIIGFYIYSNSVILDKNNYAQNYTKIENLEFEHLPSYIKSNYIKKYDCPKSQVPKTVTTIDNSKTEMLEEEIKILKQKLNEKSIKIVEKKVSVIQKETIVINEDIFNKSNYKVAKCYDMNVGDYYLSTKCEQNIKKFLFENSNAKYFEVIGILDRDDFLVLNKLKRNLDVLEKLNLTPRRIKKLEKFADIGLASKRVEETIWFIKESLGESTKVIPVNYTITSKKHHKGTVVRVYY